MPDSSKNYKSYRTSGILFSISGLVFIALSISAVYFLPIGIALFVIGMGLWQKSRKIKENEQSNSSEVNR